MRKIYNQFFIVALALMVFASDGFCQTPILFIGRDNLGAYQSDQDLYDSLIAWGYAGFEGEPDFWDSNGEYNTALGDAINYDDYAVMLINETVDSKAVIKVAQNDYPLPCVVLEGYAVATGNDRWEWLSDNASELLQPDQGTEDDLSIVIKDNSHYITEIFEVGDEVAWSGITGNDILATTPVSIKEVNVSYDGKLAKTKAADAEDDFWNLVTVDDIEGSGNRMVFWGINANGLNGEGQTLSEGTPEFYTIVKRALEWVQGAGGGTGVETAQTNRFELTAYPNPASERLNIRFRMEAPGEVSATLYNTSGQAVDMFSKTAAEGRNFLYLDADSYPAGIYHLQLYVGGESAITKVVIQ